VGLGCAAKLLISEIEDDAAHAAALRAQLLSELAEKAPHVKVVGSAGVPGIVFLFHNKIRGDELALRLDMAGIAVSSGSACDAGTRKAPRALEYVLDEQSALRGGIRLSFGRGTERAHIEAAVAVIAKL
jgi:cysteine desulfurase